MPDLHCPRCGYSLRGNTTDQCPECGERAALDEIGDRFSKLRQNWERSYRLAVRIVSLQSFAFIFFAMLGPRRISWDVMVFMFLSCLCTALLAAIRLGYDRGVFFALERTVYRGRPGGVAMLVYSVALAVVMFVGFQLLFLCFGMVIAMTVVGSGE